MEKQARRRERLPADALIAGVDLAKKEAVVVYVRASDRARVLCASCNARKGLSQRRR
jgi:hypothetical protein